MNKTAYMILDDVVAKLKVGGMESVISGKIYKKKRPDNSMLEDCVVSFKTGADGQFQNGVVTINVYVSNVNNGQSSLVENVARTSLIESELSRIYRRFTTGEYLFTPANIVETWEVEDSNMHQHFVHLDLEFNRIIYELKNQ